MQIKMVWKQMNNYLPEVPEAEKDGTAIKAYRSLGIIALLDVAYWQGESEVNIGQYYAVRLAHKQAETMIIAINKEQKPIGYAIWDEDDSDQGTIKIRRQAAPFGDHLELQDKLRDRLPNYAKVLSYHSRSARKEQTAW
jgi:hemolysin-activating ACP:hemolysin acyltransferase